MALRLHPLDPARPAAWDAYVAADPRATFFHQAAWAGILARAFGHRPRHLMAERDGAVVGVLPLVEVRSRLFGHRLSSSPFCVYGGPLAADRETFEALLAEARRQLASTGAATLELRFLEQPAAGWLDDVDWPARADLYATFRRPMLADDDANLRAIPRKQRAMVRKGIERGLVARFDQDVDGLYAIYATSVRDLGTPVFPRRYFRLLREAFGHAMEVLSVSHEGRTVAAVLSFYWRGEVLPYYGGGTAAARACHAHDFMYWEVMRAAARRGCTLFDFGRSKVGTGAFAFKKNWGFTAAPLLHRYALAPGRSIPEHNPLNPKYRLLIAAWRRLPLPVANLLGPHLVRGIG